MHRPNALIRMGMGLAAAAILLSAAAAAQTAPQAVPQTVPLGPNPSECDIRAALLGSVGPDCPPLRRRPPPEPAPPAEVAAPATPAPVPPPKVALRVAFRVNFAFDSARIRPESRPTLDHVAAVMKTPEAHGLRFRVVGHTDARGGDAYNLALSERRAKAVVDYLVARHGIARNRLEAVGMGSRDLLLPKQPDAAENRRVEIVNLGG